ncbi:MAG TPA: arginine deiminase family protein [Vicinamibacterales bacterium]|nr:arginine deiminase family protein [Vicinamibacterales bacterium]
MSDVGPWNRILLRHVRDGFVDDASIGRQWDGLNFTAPPDFGRAVEQYERFVSVLKCSGADVLTCSSTPPQHISTPALPHDSTSAQKHTSTVGLGLDSIYVRDASVMCARGAILCRMGKPQREAEPAALAECYRSLGIPIAGAIEAPGTLEGGDVTWLGPRLPAVGRGYRTNDEGIRQLRILLGDTVDDLLVVPLPHYRGPGDVFHLMSILSPVDHDLAVVYSPLMVVSFREALLGLGYTLVEVPPEEFDSMGANVFALSPRRCLMVEGNPKTRAALERAGAEVLVYDGSEISIKGGGGPTCLTRPVLRLR